MREHKSLKFTDLLEDPHVKRWHMNLARGSQVTAEVALRRMVTVCALLGMAPGEMVDQARKDLAGFQDLLEDSVAKLETEQKAPGYILGILKAVKSWLKYNDVTLPRRIRVKNSSATPTIEDEQIPSKEELARILRTTGIFDIES